MRTFPFRFIRLLVAVGLAAWTAASAGGCRKVPIAEGAKQPSGVPAAGAATELRPGRIEKGRLSGPAPAAYRVALRPGEYLRASIEQRGVDVAATLLDPAGGEILAVDSPTGERGVEEIFFVAERVGTYLVQVRPFSKGSGGEYEVRTERRAATRDDRTRAMACRTVSEADAAVGDPASRRRAIGQFAEALELWRRSGEVYQEALTETKLGKALSAAGEMGPATHHLERALKLHRQLGIENRQPALYNYLGLSYERLGAFEQARAAFAEAQESARRVSDSREATAAINNLGLLEQDAGEPWKALVLFDKALAGWRELEDRSGEAVTLHNLGTLYTVLGQLPEARESLEGALGLYRSAGRRHQEAATLVALGWVRFLQGDPAGARADLLLSLDLRRATGQPYGEAVTLDRLGTLSRETRQFDRAISEYRQALAILDRIGDSAGRARTLSNLGEALILAGDATAGLRCESEALKLLERQGGASAEAFALFRRARAEQALGSLEAAWADMSRAIPKLEEIRERARSDDFRMTYLDSVHEQYELAVDLLMELHARKPAAGFDRRALEMAERARARGLLDLVHEARGRRTAESGPANETLHRLEEELRAAETRQAERVARGGKESAVAAEESRIRRLLKEREKVQVELRLAASGNAVAAQPVDLQKIQSRLLDDGTVLLVYALGERRSFLWVVDRREIASAVLPPRREIETAAERLHSLLARRQRGSGKQWELIAAELSRVLVGPAGRLLENKRIVVVPDGTLAYVPFGVLPEPYPAGQPLLVRHEVVVLPSASVLAAIRERAAARPPAPNLLAVIADPVFSADDPRLAARGHGRSAPEKAGVALLAAGAVTRSAEDLGLRDLARLPFSRQEGEAILAFAPPKVRFGATDFAANLSLLTEGRLASFRYVHFATHALIHPRNPELSGVVLSLFDEQGRSRPGFLRSYQILSSRLSSDLVVLSACRTGLGQALNGEGLVGLTQSFFHAGASRVAVSLWEVDDQATARLMERFYRELLVSGRSPSASLRLAQLSMRDDTRFAAPYYWAGFVLQGEWR